MKFMTNKNILETNLSEDWRCSFDFRCVE